MARTKGMLNLSGNLEVNAGAPLDARTVVPTVADLTIASNFPYRYVGLPVVVQATGDMYVLIDMDVTDISHWKLTGGSGGGYTPLGTILPYFGETAPRFYLACDGTVYNKADYPELANHLLSLTNHSQYEVDGDATKFKVPDLRGEFLRGTGTNGHVDTNGVTQGSGADVGVHQNSTEIPDIKTWGTHFLIETSSNSSSTQTSMVYNKDSSTGSRSSRSYLDTTGGYITQTSENKNERFTSRPTNTSVLWCIAYKDIYTNPINDYSTTEKVVGTWIDGKPIWQDTVSTGGNVPSGATLILRTAMASTGYDTILYTKTS